jgi:hypothetical protein
MIGRKKAPQSLFKRLSIFVIESMLRCDQFRKLFGFTSDGRANFFQNLCYAQT